MSTALLSEELRPLAFACKNWIPRIGANPAAPSTPWRWAKRGIGLPDGSKAFLEVAYVGRVVMTSKEAVQRFLTAVTKARLGDDDAGAGVRSDDPPPRSPETAAKLAAHGVL